MRLITAGSVVQTREKCSLLQEITITLEEGLIRGVIY
jgi:hypothetical protein